MRKKLLAIAAVGLMATVTMTACDDSGDSGDTGSGSSNTSSGNGKARVGVILPDTESSKRWGNEDPKFLKAAFDEAKVPVEIVNAQGDRAKFVQALSDGIGARNQELAETITGEVGMPLFLSQLIQAGLPASIAGSLLRSV